MENQTTEWLSEADVIKWLNLKKSTLYSMRKKKLIVSSVIGRKCFYDKNSLNNYLNNNQK
jgi:hypothetical protein